MKKENLMSKEVTDFIEKLSQLDNEHMHSIIKKFTNVINKRHTLLETALKNKDLVKFKEVIPLFKNYRGSQKAYEILTGLNYQKEDLDFFKHVYSNLNFIDVKKTHIMNHFLTHSLQDINFFNMVKVDFKDALKNIINKQFTKDKLTKIEPKLFTQLIDFCDLTLKKEYFNTYTKDENFLLLKEIFESGKFDKFLYLKHKEIIDIAINNFQTNATEYLMTLYNKEKKATLVLDNDTIAEKFCLTPNTKFYYYVLNDFEFDNTSLMYLTYHLAKVKIFDKWINSIQILVEKIDDLDLLEQLKRKINISQNEDFKEVANKEFNYAYLNKTLESKQLTKQMKI